jgi:hypothetical protein
VLLGRNADSGVHYGKADGHFRIVIGLALRFDADVALLGELDGVASEIDEDLADARGVTKDEVRNVAVDGPSELETLLLRARR